MTTLQYLTDEDGQQVGVLLDLESYRQLTGQSGSDPDLLIGLSEAELQALADSQLASTAQNRLDTLLEHQSDQPLSSEENDELDQLLAQVDQLTILKTRARYTLNQQRAQSIAA